VKPSLWIKGGCRFIPLKFKADLDIFGNYNTLVRHAVVSYAPPAIRIGRRAGESFGNLRWPEVDACGKRGERGKNSN